MERLWKARFQSRPGSITRVLFLALLVAIGPLALQEPAGAQGRDTILILIPASAQISPDDVITTDVGVSGLSSLAAIQFKIRFDPNVLQVVDGADPSQPATQVTLGERFGNWVPHRNDVSNGAGLIDVDLVVSGPDQAVSGSATVVSITWRAVGAGISDLTFSEFGLTDSGTAIVPVIRNGWIEVLAETDIPTPTDIATPSNTPTFTATAASTPAEVPTKTPVPTREPGGPVAPESVITGVVRLQGRSAYAGTNMFLGEAVCPGSLPASPAAITDEAGHFAITPAPGRAYQCLQAVQPGYLTGQKASPHGDVGSLTLPGGDVIGDNRIDLEDLKAIAADYHGMTSSADLNADGVVDVYDLAMASGNFGQQGPVEDWQ